MSDNPPRCPHCGEPATCPPNSIQILVLDDAGREWHSKCAKRVLAAVQTEREKRNAEEGWFQHARPKEEV